MLNVEFDSEEAFQRFADFTMEQVGNLFEVAGTVFEEIAVAAQKINEYFE